ELEGGPVLMDQPLHHGGAPAVQALEGAGRATLSGVRGEERKGDTAVGIDDDRSRQLIRIDLAPAHRLGRSSTGESSSIGTSIGHLQKIVMTTLVDSQHLLNLGLGLEHEVLG